MVSDKTKIDNLNKSIRRIESDIASLEEEFQETRIMARDPELSEYRRDTILKQMHAVDQLIVQRVAELAVRKNQVALITTIAALQISRDLEAFDHIGGQAAHSRKLEKKITELEKLVA